MPGIEYYRDDGLPVFEIKSCEAGVHATRIHAHDEFSFGLILGGTSRVGGAGRDGLVGPGDAIAIWPGVMHDCRPEDSGDWRFRMLFVRPAWLETAFGATPAGRPFSIRRLAAEDLRRLFHLFLLLRGDLAPLEKESCLIAAIERFLDSPAGEGTATDPLPRERKSLREVKDFIHAHYLECITLNDLAGLAGLGKYSLLRGFKRLYHASPHSYQTVLRINHAKRELRSRRDAPIAVIAQEAGFFDQSHFNKVFRRYTGATPSEYRRGWR